VDVSQKIRPCMRRRQCMHKSLSSQPSQIIFRYQFWCQRFLVPTLFGANSRRFDVGWFITQCQDHERATGSTFPSIILSLFASSLIFSYTESTPPPFFLSFYPYSRLLLSSLTRSRHHPPSLFLHARTHLPAQTTRTAVFKQRGKGRVGEDGGNKTIRWESKKGLQKCARYQTRD
jgi:hypothetical protein